MSPSKTRKPTRRASKVGKVAARKGGAKKGKAKAARPAAPRKAPRSAKPAAAQAQAGNAHAHCAASDPFGDPCQNLPRRPSKYCVIHSYLER